MSKVPYLLLRRKYLPLPHAVAARVKVVSAGIPDGSDGLDV